MKAIWRRPYSMVLAGALAVAVGATAVTLARTPGAGPSGKAEEVVVTMPRIVNLSASEVLDRAAKAASRTDLAPRDDQFIKVESQTMYGSFGGGAVNGETGATSEETRYLYRTKRVIWQSADGTRDGALTIEYLKPKAYPGWPIPEQAYEDTGTAELPLPICGGKIPDYMRTDYASLKNLPSDADGMRAHLYTGDRGGGSKDGAAFTAAGDMLRETYMPPAQRAALFKAVGTIPGVGVIETAEDAAGRKGIGVGRARPGRCPAGSDLRSEDLRVARRARDRGGREGRQVSRGEPGRLDRPALGHRGRRGSRVQGQERDHQRLRLIAQGRRHRRSAGGGDVTGRGRCHRRRTFGAEAPPAGADPSENRAVGAACRSGMSFGRGRSVVDPVDR
ncbi:CU044_5270 family protein [Streptosporangium lutulentum]